MIDCDLSLFPRNANLQAVTDLLELLRVVLIDTADFSRTMAISLNDFEDAVQVAACSKVGAGFLITRNSKDFKNANVRPRTPDEVLSLLTTTSPRTWKS